MAIIYDFDESRHAMKKAQVKEWFHGNVNNMQYRFSNDSKTALLSAPNLIGAVTTLVDVVSKSVNLRKEKNLKELYCYDRSLGHYWTLRRKLTNREWVEIDKRKNNGERLADILSEMKVLK